MQVTFIFNSFQLANENKILAQRDIQLLLNVIQKGVLKEIAKTIINIVALFRSEASFSKQH